MKLPTILAASIAMAVLSVPASAGVPSMLQIEAPATQADSVGLSWRCGKNNPAWWGTFGNGCLKQKRAAKKGSAATSGSGNFTINRPAPPPRPLRLTN